MTETQMDSEGLPVVEDAGGEAMASVPTETPPAPAQTEAKPTESPKPDDDHRRGLIAELQAERRARREADEERQRMRARFAEIEKRFEDMTRPKPAPIPDRDVDPVAHFDARLAQLEQPLNKTQEWVAEQERRAQAEQHAVALRTAVANAEQTFMATTPDYYEALEFAKDIRTKELQALGYTPAEIPGLIYQDAEQIAIRALRDQANPAERFYAFAKARGWTGKKAEAPRDDSGKFATLQAGAKAQGLGGAAAAPTKDSPSLADIAAMSDEDFDREWNKYRARAMREAG